MAYNCDIFKDGSCIAFYDFEGNVKDACGNYDGIWHGNEQYDKGIVGQAAKFDGNSYIELSNSFASENFTLSLWFKQGPLDKSKQSALFSFSCDNKNTLVLFQCNTYSNKCMIFNINDQKDIVMDSTYEDNKWHHLVITNTSYYIDGKFKANFNQKINSISFNKNAVIGADIDSNGINDFAQNNTFIDYFRIFNKVLTDDEIKILYNEVFKLKNIQVLENKNTINNPDPFKDNSCIATYTFDDQTAKDLLNKHNGIWHGTEQYDIGVFNGYAAKFDNNQVIVLDNTDIIENMQKFISLWFRLDKSENKKKVLFNLQQDDAGWTNFEIFIDTNRKIVIGGRNKDHSNVSYTTVFTSSEPIELNKFYHLVINKINDITYNVYLNNKLIGSFDFTFYIPANSYRQTIGAFINSSDYSDIIYGWDGLIDQIRIFNRTLIDDEIKQLYYEQTTFKFSTDKYKKLISFNPKSINLDKADFFKDNSGVLNLPLEKNANDLLNNYNGTWQGNEQYQNNIFFGNAYFDGNSWIELPDGLEKLFTKNNTFTITGWFKFHSFENWSRIFDFKGVVVLNNSSTDSISLCEFKYDAIENNDYSKGKRIKISGINTNLWYFYAITWDGNDLDIILKSIDNKLLFGSKEEFTNISSPSDSIIKNYIGHSNWSSSGDNLFKGEQARIKIFNRVLTQEEIDYLFNEGDYLISSENYTTDSKREKLIIGLDFTKRKLFYEVPGLYQKYLINQSRFDIPFLEDKNYILEIEHQTSSSIVNIKDENSIIFNQELKHGVLASIIEDSQEYSLTSGINITNPGVASDILANKDEIALFTGEAKDDILGFVSFDNTIEIIENNYDLKSKFKINLETGQFIKKFSPFRYTLVIPASKTGLNITISNIEENEEIYMIIPIINISSSNVEIELDSTTKNSIKSKSISYIVQKIYKSNDTIINEQYSINIDENIDILKRNILLNSTGTYISTNMYLKPSQDIYVSGIYFTKKLLKILSGIWSNIQLPIVDSYYYSIDSKFEAIYY